MRPSGYCKTPTSTSSPTISVSTIALPATSASRAASSAAGKSCQSATLETPIEEPPRAGFTNTGRPKRCLSSSASSSPAPTTASGVTGSCSETSSFFVYSLSMLAAEDNTPVPTYGISANSSMPWMVPSSPNGPCSTGKTTSNSACTLPVVRLCSTRRCGFSDNASSSRSVTSGNWPATIFKPCSPTVNTPSLVIPTGITS